MKVALLTIWHELNYGAELQAYATIKAIQKLGYEVEMIDIRLSDCEYKNFKGKIVTSLSSIGPCQKKFESFWDKYIPKTHRYTTIKQLKENPPIADVYMVGSDQVWNPQITGAFSKLFFLDFGSENIRRVSFASSFGVNQWKYPELQEDIKKLLSRFHMISCRESSGVDLLKKTFGLDASPVLDPTLLFSSYKELIGDVTPNKSLVYYPLSNEPELVSYSKNLAKRLHLKPVNNKKCSYIIKPIVWDRVSIEQWIKNIAEAEFVITRSFHGLVFSIIYHKNFAILESNNNRGTRITNLLELLGLSKRLYTSIEDLDRNEPWNKPVDYNSVNTKLLSLRNTSWKILKKMIE